MGRSLSPILRRELENLDKDADSRKSAMKALKLYVKDLDSKAIPMFLAQVSETKQTGLSSGEHTISLYEVLARVHGPKIVPQIDNIMGTIVKTLSLSAGAFALHQSCSKVVPAIARYAIEPTTAEERKRHVIHSLCKPLSDCLMGSQEGLSSGAALCLQALVESDNWRFASSEMVNEVCLKVAGALEKHKQTHSHMGLVTALVKHNSLIVEAYARLLIHSGLQILDAGFVEENSQKRLSAIHMVSSLLRYLDSRSVSSELELVIKEMEKCQSDRMPFVAGAAFEVLQIAKRISSDRCSKMERDIGSATGSSFGRREVTRVRNACSSERFTASPESQTLDSFAGYDYFESPNSKNHGHHSLDYSHKSVNRRLWRRCENGILDVSLKDGIFSDIARGDSKSSVCDEISHNHGDFLENFSGFIQGSAENEVVGSNTPSPQRSTSHIQADDFKIFTTPRKLIRSLQEDDDCDAGSYEEQPRRFRSPMSRKCSPQSQRMRFDHKMDRSEVGGEHFYGSSESVSSTDDVSTLAEIVPTDKPPLKKLNNSTKKAVCGVFVGLFAVFLSLVVMGDQDDHYGFVPT